jgi:hypothetical protein
MEALVRTDLPSKPVEAECFIRLDNDCLPIKLPAIHRYSVAEMNERVNQEL